MDNDAKQAAAEPRFAKLPVGSDPLAYIASANLMRRNLTKGQLAMAYAMRHPEAEHGGKRKKGSSCVTQLDIEKSRLSRARAVLRYSPELAAAVVKNVRTLDEAYAIVREQQQYQQSDEAKLARLRESAPDLAEQVNEERLKINEAIAALSAREQELREVCEAARLTSRSQASAQLAAASSLDERDIDAARQAIRQPASRRTSAVVRSRSEPTLQSACGRHCSCSCPRSGTWPLPYRREREESAWAA